MISIFAGGVKTPANLLFLITAGLVLYTTSTRKQVPCNNRAFRVAFEVS